MVDVEVTILGSSLNQRGININYKVKSSWCHVNIENGKSVRLPRLPISHKCSLEETKTVVYLEFWLKDEICSPDEEAKFFGLAECCLTRQIQFPNLNPTVQWWDVYDPIRGLNQGKVLLRIDAELTISQSKTSLPSLSCKSISGKITEGSCSKLFGASSYFPSTNRTEVELKCQEVQTDISLVLFQNNKTRNDIFHANNTGVNTDVPKDLLPFFAPSSCNFRRLNNASVEDSTFKKYAHSNMASKGKLSKNSERDSSKKINAALKEVLNETTEQSYEVAQSTDQSSPSVFNKGFLGRSDSVENIISLLNNNRISRNDTSYDGKLKDCKNRSQCHSDNSATLSETLFQKAGKDGYNHSKVLIEQGRTAPESKNQFDGDFTSNPNGPLVQSMMKDRYQAPVLSKRMAALFTTTMPTNSKEKQST